MSQGNDARNATREKKLAIVSRVRRFSKHPEIRDAETAKFDAEQKRLEEQKIAEQQELQRIEDEKRIQAKAQAEADRIAQEKAEAEKIKADRQAITDRYGSQIDDIQRQKEPSLVFKPWTGKQPYLHNSTPVIRPDGTRTTHRGWVPRGYKIGKLVPQTQSRIRHLNGRINSLKHQQRGELNRYDAQAYPSWAKSGWSSSSFPDTSLAEYAQRKIDAKNAEAERARQSSIKNAQSAAIKAREKSATKQKEQFEQNRQQQKIKEQQDAAKVNASIASVHVQQSDLTKSGDLGITFRAPVKTQRKPESVEKSEKILQEYEDYKSGDSPLTKPNASNYMPIDIPNRAEPHSETYRKWNEEHHTMEEAEASRHDITTEYGKRILNHYYAYKHGLTPLTDDVSSNGSPVIVPAPSRGDMQNDRNSSEFYRSWHGGMAELHQVT